MFMLFRVKFVPFDFLGACDRIFLLEFVYASSGSEISRDGFSDALRL